MCGIIGVHLDDITPGQIIKVKNLIHESSIRGIHAAGISYLKNGVIRTDNAHGSSDSFMEDKSVEDFIDSKDLHLIGHTRYSTSDLEFNQPIGDKTLSVVHNGVISQASPKSWKKLFGLTTKTTNDSELIFAALKMRQSPLEKFEGSMAVCVLTKDNLVAFRNHERPLWFCNQPNGVIFASTKDILLRSGFKNPEKCEMFCKYFYAKGILLKMPLEIPEGITDLQC
jgi:glutamine phosphoribosylpyrophosphate amidotransferase